VTRLEMKASTGWFLSSSMKLDVKHASGFSNANSTVKLRSQ
jgi:hypothetical protein